jgi:ribonuclease HI
MHESIKLRDDATVFQAEVLAIKEAAGFIRSNLDAKYVKILSDSQAALLALASNTVNSRGVLDTMKELEHLSLNGTVVRLAWVKAHVGLEGNELADSAAKLGGLDEMGTNRKVQLLRPLSSLKADISTAIRDEWGNRWLATDKYRMTKQFLTRPNAGSGRRVLQLSKSSLSRLIQIVTGHNFLSYFQFKLDSTINPLCRMCEEENETFYHLITQCPALETTRRDVFLDSHPVTDDWKPGEILKFSFLEPINSWLTDKDYLMEQPMLELDVNYSITDSDTSL